MALEEQKQKNKKKTQKQHNVCSTFTKQEMKKQFQVFYGWLKKQIRNQQLQKPTTTNPSHHQPPLPPYPLTTVPDCSHHCSSKKSLTFPKIIEIKLISTRIHWGRTNVVSMLWNQERKVAIIKLATIWVQSPSNLAPNCHVFAVPNWLWFRLKPSRTQIH